MHRHLATVLATFWTSTALAAALVLVAKTTDLFGTAIGRIALRSLEPWLVDLIRVETALAKPVVVILTVVALIIAAFVCGGARWAAVAAAAPAVVALTGALKEGFGPETALPSGHVAYVTSVLGLAVLLAAASGRIRLALLLLVPIVAMGPVRVIGGAHTVPDVMAGYAVGLSWLLLIALVGAGRAQMP